MDEKKRRTGQSVAFYAALAVCLTAVGVGAWQLLQPEKAGQAAQSGPAAVMGPETPEIEAASGAAELPDVDAPSATDADAPSATASGAESGDAQAVSGKAESKDAASGENAGSASSSKDTGSGENAGSASNSKDAKSGENSKDASGKSSKGSASSSKGSGESSKGSASNSKGSASSSKGSGESSKGSASSSKGNGESSKGSASSSKGNGESSKGSASSSKDAGNGNSKDAKAGKPSGEVVRPVEGAVVTGYSMDKLLYNETMRDWRTHDGIDIAADAGTAVVAARAGTVESVTFDPIMGATVTIRHEGAWESAYSSLTDAPEAEAGDEVAAGQVIGFVGQTAASESALGPHLHFAVLNDGAPSDPEAFLS